jgi:hypothetical protein
MLIVESKNVDYIEMESSIVVTRFKVVEKMGTYWSKGTRLHYLG